MSVHPVFQEIAERHGLVPPQDRFVDAIRLLNTNPAALTDQQLFDLGKVFRAALVTDAGEPRRHFENIELEAVLQDAREFSPEPPYCLAEAPEDFAASRAEVSRMYTARLLGDLA